MCTTSKHSEAARLECSGEHSWADFDPMMLAELHIHIVKRRAWLANRLQLKSLDSDDDLMTESSVLKIVVLGGIRNCAVHSVQSERKEFGQYQHLFPQLKKICITFLSTLGMDYRTFEYILNLISPYIVLKCTNFVKQPNEIMYVVDLTNEAPLNPRGKEIGGNIEAERVACRHGNQHWSPLHNVLARLTTFLILNLLSYALNSNLAGSPCFYPKSVVSRF